MQENVTLPPSIVAQIAEATALAETGDPVEANALLSKAVAELASKNPDMCAMVILAQIGIKDLTVDNETVQITDGMYHRHLLGLDLGTSVKTLQTTTRVEKSYKVR